jgi:hypothetical protein
VDLNLLTTSQLVVQITVAIVDIVPTDFRSFGGEVMGSTIIVFQRDLYLN